MVDWHPLFHLSKLHIIRFVKEEEEKLSYEIGTGKASKQLGIQPSITGWRNAKKEHKDIAFVGSGNQRLIINLRALTSSFVNLKLWGEVM